MEENRLKFAVVEGDHITYLNGTPFDGFILPLTLVSVHGI